MRSKLNDKQKMMAYILNRDEDMRYSQRKIGDLMGVSSSTISNAVKEMEYRKTIQSLENELQETRAMMINDYPEIHERVNRPLLNFKKEK